MKKILSSLIALCFFAFAQAQAPIAMLSHSGLHTPYYGTDALVDAYAAAQNGDIITLSSGVFNACDIRKGITLRGAGMMTDTVAGTLRTTINGNFKLHNDNNGLSLTLEGLYIESEMYMDTIWNLQINKCFVNKFCNPWYSSQGVHNGTFTHSIFRDLRTAWLYNCNFYNCVLRENTGSGADFYSSDNSTVCDHCIIQLRNTSGTTRFHSTNSILLYDDPGIDPGHDQNNCLTHEYCIGISHYGSYGDPFFHPGNYVSGQHLYSYLDCTDVFVDFNRDVSVFADYHLVDGVDTVCLGNDNTQVGIYGGSMPFNPSVNNPGIGHITVDGQTNSQGQLPVHIQIINEQ